MKKHLLFGAFALMTFVSSAQHYASVSNTDTFTSSMDTLHFSFDQVPQTAWSQAIVKVYFRGPFDWTSTSFNLYSENNSFIGNNWGDNAWCRPNFDSSNVYVIPNDSLINWSMDNTIEFTAYIPTSSWYCNGCCTFNDVYLSIEYDYCDQFSNEGFANIEIADQAYCRIDGTVNPILTPNGGTLTGAGVSGSSINVASLNGGSYDYTYTYTDSVGCESFEVATLRLRNDIPFADQWACQGDDKVLAGVRENGLYTWHSDSAQTLLIDTANSIVFNNIQGPEMVIAQEVGQRFLFEITGIDTSDFWYEDHNSFTGDDRNGIAVTDHHVFVTGDNNTARMNHDLSPASMVSLQRVDGIFSDAATGRLYALYDGNNVYAEFWNTYSIRYIVELDSNLNIVQGTEVELSEELFYADNTGWVLCAGAGFIIMWNDVYDNWVHIDLYSGAVTALADDSNPNQYYGENWADWGVAMFDGTDFSVMYRKDVWPARWDVKTFSGGAIVSDVPFMQWEDLDDNATITYSTMLERFYVHAEGSGQLYGNGYAGEMVAWFAGTSVTQDLGTVAVGCPTIVEIDVNTIDLGADTVVCNNVGFDLVAGVGFMSYSWNGINNNYNAIRVDSSGTYTVLAIDEYGCEVTDNIVVTMNDCVGINEINTSFVSLFPNPTADNVTINSDLDGNKAIVVYDVTGRVVASQNTTSNIVTVSLGHLNSGVYKVVVTADEGVQAINVIKQ